LNRQDGEDEYHVADAALGEGDDPASGATPSTIACCCLASAGFETGSGLPWAIWCANSQMTVACAVEHLVEADCEPG
jgi:alpha,alpha-trehalose phosphorylase